MTRPLILIVDDVADNRLLLECLLEDDFDTVCATGEREALNTLAEQKSIALVLLDLHMPDMDGIETCEKIRSVESTAGTPVIFVSAETDADEKQRAIQAGANAFLYKPIDEEVLIRQVKTCLN